LPAATLTSGTGAARLSGMKCGILCRGRYPAWRSPLPDLRRGSATRWVP
jgi:hypothetical protein